MKTFKMKILASMVITSMTMSLSAMASDKNIGDLSIYRAAQPAEPTLMMMFDTSGSMGGNSIALTEDYGSACLSNYRINITTKTYTYVDPAGGQGFTHTVNLAGCSAVELDRLSILKDALLTLLTQPGELDDNTKMGLGNYGAGNYKKSGAILIPAKKLTPEHRKRLADAIVLFNADGGTPTAHALAEAGAYMMGTTTAATIEDVWYLRSQYRSSTTTRNCLVYNAPQTMTMTSMKPSYNQRLNLTINGRFATCNTWGGWGNNGYSFDVYQYSNSMYNMYVNDVSASGFDTSAADTKDNNHYAKGANESECAGNGIYLLTDGLPNSSSDTVASSLMNASLNNGSLSINNCNNSFVSGSASQGWGCMANYAKQLRNPANPGQTEIVVATTGLGAVFAGLPQDVDGDYDCEGTIDISNPPPEDVRNLCRLGSKNARYQLGKGGFTHVTESDDLKDSIRKFIQNLSKTVSTTPSGIITIPADPLSATNLQPYAYLPMLEPKVDKAVTIWPGNLKKYKVAQGTLFGENNSRLYIKAPAIGSTPAGKFPHLLNPATKDLWMGSLDHRIDGNVVNSAVEAGGVYARLKAPNPINPNSIRTVWVEDIIAVGSSDTKLVKVGVQAAGGASPILIGFGSLLDDAYTIEAKVYLLNYLGYNVSTDFSMYAGLTDSEQTAKLSSQIQVPVNEIKVLGGIVHSKPTLVSYGGKFNAVDKDTVSNLTGASGGDGFIDEDAGQVTSVVADRDDYLMFGSMEGALHLVKAETGEENYAVIPLTTIKQQVRALQKNSLGSLEFGLDAPWVSDATYKVNLGASKIKADKVYAYGGMRMGGNSFYGLDLSRENTPRMLFNIDRTTGGFERLGQTWSEPLVTKIKYGPDLDDVQSVIVFGGGYDMCYESPTFKLSTDPAASNTTDSCTNKKSAYGNAIYMVDATTGRLIKSWSTADMKHSVVGGITGLDRNANGTIDHLYFADLGGKVFRIDLNEGFRGDAMTKRVVKVFDANERVTTTNHIPYRFYGRPIVSFYKSPPPIEERFAVVNIASGDRSSPLSTRRSVGDANRVYGIFDRDIAQTGLFGTTIRLSDDLVTGDLIALPPTTANRQAQEDLVKDSVYNTATKRYEYAKQGWYYPLDRFDGYMEIPHVKSMGDGTVMASRYYMTAYSPNMKYGEKQACEAGITGGSERQLYCLPYGICNQKDANGILLSTNGTGGSLRGGPGIQELAFGATNDANLSTSVLISNQTFTEVKDVDNRADSGNADSGNGGEVDTESALIVCDAIGNCVKKPGGDVRMGLPVFELDYQLIPKRWYELQN